MYAFATALVGTGVEATLTHLGYFYYVKPTLSSVTLWLPSLYLWAASAGGAIDRLLEGTSA